ncbi:MAG: DegQ family serine endoprotease [Verrucomicrobiae bacterium]|nr:DegQ family serine endoprotease [Verrucomicrobiae bacterium]
MKDSRRLQALGWLVGLALFVATGLLITIGTDRPRSSAPRAVSSESVASLQALSDTFAEVAAKVKPSVVTVYSEKIVRLPEFRWPFDDEFPFRWFFGEPPGRGPQRERQFRQSGMGSGIIVDREGHILTNHHVVEGMDEISVKLANGARYDAELIGSDPKTDLAVLRIKGRVPRDLVPAELGDSDALRVGDWVLAIGAPFGYEQTVTAGIISAKGRTGVNRDASRYEDFLQTDAAINPGNSGGPLVNLRGEVVGINTAIATRIGQFAGVGFAIPIRMAQHVMRDLIANGKVTRGYLGIIIQDLTPELAEQFGVSDAKGALVAQVAPESPAQRAGLQVGDVIVRYDGRAVDDVRRLRNMVADTPPGKSVTVEIMRDGKTRRLQVEVGQLPDDETVARGFSPPAARTSVAAELGLEVEPLTSEKARALGIEGENGILVSEVKPDSAAAAAGLLAGDVVTEVDRRPVRTVEEFSTALQRARAKSSVLLLVRSREGSRFVVLRFDPMPSPHR